jgi:adenylate kinase family enzyme
MKTLSITAIVGLPGAGKTTLANKLYNKNTFLIDDFSLNKHLIEEFHKQSVNELIITDPRLCEAKKEKAEKVFKRYFGEDIIIKWIAFENNLEVCWNNVQKRNDNRIIGKHFLETLSKQYNPLEFTNNPKSVFKVE